MVGWRVRRGFRRMALIVAVPAAVVAVGAGALGGINWTMSPQAISFAPRPSACRHMDPGNPSAKYVNPRLFDDLQRDKSAGDAEHQRCVVQYGKDLDEHTRWDANHRTIGEPYEMFALSAGAAALGALWYAAFWAIGWMLVGFAARDEEAS